MVNAVLEKNTVADHVAITVMLLETSDDNNNHTSTCAQSGDFDADTPKPVVGHNISVDERSPLLASLTQEPSKSRLETVWKWYQRCLWRSPVLTKSLTASIIVGSGDFVGQCLEATSAISIDWWRCIRFALMGLFLQAPITHYYYLLLDAKFPPTLSPWTLTTLIKLLIDQCLWAPSFTLGVFLFMGLLEGDSLAQIAEQLHHEYATVITCNWKLWVPAAVVNMAWCPPELRVLYCNVIFFFWSIILSILLNASADAHQWTSASKTP